MGGNGGGYNIGSVWTSLSRRPGNQRTMWPSSSQHEGGGKRVEIQSSAPALLYPMYTPYIVGALFPRGNTDTAQLAVGTRGWWRWSV